MTWASRRAVLLCGLALAAGVQAAGVAKADVKKIRGVIEAQLAAFAADDAQRAFSHASAGIRQMFGTPERFLDMVRRGYPVVYRPVSVSFLAPEGHDGSVIQAVEMTDADGGVWVALYSLERQKDGSWRIGGCELQPVKAQGT